MHADALTDEDRAALVECATLYGLGQALDAAYRAGLAAGRARAIERCAKVCDAEYAANWSASAMVAAMQAKRCAVAIRALPK
jgi:hypothetical protein